MHWGLESASTNNAKIVNKKPKARKFTEELLLYLVVPRSRKIAPTRWPRLLPAAAPTDPYVRSLAHTVPQNRGSLCNASRRLIKRGLGSG